jgi:hypothetical protein
MAIHTEDTGQPYRWFRREPGETTYPSPDLPEVSRDQVVEVPAGRPKPYCARANPNGKYDPKAAGAPNYEGREREAPQVMDHDSADRPIGSKLGRALDTLTEVTDYEATLPHPAGAQQSGTKTIQSVRLALAYRWAALYPDFFRIR